MSARRELLDELDGPALAALHPARPGLDRALADGERRIGDDQVRVHLRPGAEAAALRAHALRAVEGEAAAASSPKDRPQSWQALSSEKTVVLDSSGRPPADLLLVGVGDDERPLALAQRRLDRVGEPGRACSAFTTSRSMTSSMSCLSFLSSSSRSVERVDHPVDADAGEAALAARRRAGPCTRPCGSGRAARGAGASCPAGSSRIVVDDLLGGLLADRPAALRAVLHADARRRARAGSRGPR